MKNPDSSHGPHDVRNRLLLALPAATLNRISPALEPVSLIREQSTDHREQLNKYIYFINRGMVSSIMTMEDGRTVEIAPIGIEGVTNPLSPFGIVENSILDMVVQIPGTAFRIGRDVLAQEIERDKAFRQVMQNYVRFALVQLAQTVACSRLHHLEERCCRWLLIAHDNALSDTFPLTHEFLAMMLGVQRAGVSITLSLLKRSGLIESTRGYVTITNRSGLEDAACECYGAMRNELDKMFGPRK